MKNVYLVSTKKHVNMKSSVSRSFNATILLVHCLAQTCESPAIPTNT